MNVQIIYRSPLIISTGTIITIAIAATSSMQNVKQHLKNDMGLNGLSEFNLFRLNLMIDL